MSFAVWPILDVKETWQEGGGWQSSDGVKGSSQWVRKFTVTVTNQYGVVYAPTVLSDDRIPKNGSQHPTSAYLRCRSSKATRVSPIMFEVESQYKAETKDPEDNPLFAPPEISFTTLSSTEEIDEDVDGNPLNTKAGEPITGIKIPVGDLAATVTKNLADFDPASIYVYTNTVNSAIFMGFSAGVVRVHNISAKIVYADDLTYWTVTVQFHFRYPFKTDAERAWYKRLRHEGTVALNADGEIERIKDVNGEIKGGKTMLREDGTVETNPDIAHWIEFQVFRTQDLNAMGLGV